MVHGKKLVVIGGSSGLGLATAKLAAKSGAHVIIAGRSEENLHQALHEIGGNVEGHRVDATREEDLEKLFAKIGSFDYLFTPGSLSTPGSCVTLDTETAKKGFESKFWSQYLAAKRGAPHIRKDGAIVFISGPMSIKPAPNAALMGAINGAIDALAKSLALELSPIRVNVISPGLVEGPKIQGPPQKEPYKTLYDGAMQGPLQRLAKPEEIAEGVLFLCMSRYTTGTTLFVDGGYLIGATPSLQSSHGACQ